MRYAALQVVGRVKVLTNTIKLVACGGEGGCLVCTDFTPWPFDFNAAPITGYAAVNIAHFSTNPSGSLCTCCCFAALFLDTEASFGKQAESDATRAARQQGTGRG